MTFGYKTGIEISKQLTPTEEGWKYLEELYELLRNEFN
jgi:hypothetical protein